MFTNSFFKKLVFNTSPVYGAYLALWKKKFMPSRITKFKGEDRHLYKLLLEVVNGHEGRRKIHNHCV